MLLLLIQITLDQTFKRFEGLPQDLLRRRREVECGPRLEERQALLEVVQRYLRELKEIG